MRLALIGCGLIGTSATWAMKKAGVVDTVIAYNRHIESARRAVEIGAADSVAETMREAAIGADAVLIAVPVLAMRSVFEDIAPVLAQTTVISDVGSVRDTRGRCASGVRESLLQLLPGAPDRRRRENRCRCRRSLAFCRCQCHRDAARGDKRGLTKYLAQTVGCHGSQSFGFDFCQCQSLAARGGICSCQCGFIDG